MKQAMIDALYMLWLNFEYRFEMVNAYLADCRGEKWARTQHQQQAYNIQRERQIIRLNKQYGGVR